MKLNTRRRGLWLHMLQPVVLVYWCIRWTHEVSGRYRTKLFCWLCHQDVNIACRVTGVDVED